MRTASANLSTESKAWHWIRKHRLEVTSQIIARPSELTREHVHCRNGPGAETESRTTWWSRQAARRHPRKTSRLWRTSHHKPKNTGETGSERHWRTPSIHCKNLSACHLNNMMIGQAARTSRKDFETVAWISSENNTGQKWSERHYRSYSNLL